MWEDELKTTGSIATKEHENGQVRDASNKRSQTGAPGFHIVTTERVRLLGCEEGPTCELDKLWD